MKHLDLDLDKLVAQGDANSEALHADEVKLQAYKDEYTRLVDEHGALLAQIERMNRDEILKSLNMSGF